MKKITNAQAAIVNSWFKDFRQSGRITELPIGDQWSLLKAVKSIEDTVSNYESIRQSLAQKYFGQFGKDAYVTDENGNTVIKAELEDAYNEAVEKANAEFEPINKETIEVKWPKINADAIAKNLGENSKVTLNDLIFISFIGDDKVTTL